MDLKNGWVREIHQQNVALSFKIEEVLFSGRSPFQQVDIVKTKDHGIMLLNDGIIMLSERDEFIYHEMIAHVPLFVHPSPRKVLVIGGGDGGTVREILKHRQVDKVVMVEIDEMVVSACREHIPSVSGALEDPRLELRIEDGVNYVAQTKLQFDVVLVDSTDPIGPALPLFNRSFYANAAQVLSPDGILVCQSESPFYEHTAQKSMLANQRDFFNRLHLYLFPTVTYPGGLWSFSFASKGLCPSNNFSPDRVTAAAIPMRYYNPGIHRAAFQLPTFIANNFAELIDAIPPPSAA